MLADNNRHFFFFGFTHVQLGRPMFVEPIKMSPFMR